MRNRIMRKAIFSLCLLLVASTINMVADTLTLAHKTSEMRVPLSRGNIECNIDAQMPVGANKTLIENLSGRIALAVAKALDTKSALGSQMVAFSGIEEHFATHMMSQLKTQQRDAKATGLTLDVVVKREYETSRLVTFVIEVTHYGLDAKRHQVTERISLLKQNGKALQWNDLMDKKQKAKLCKAASRSLYGFFGVVDFRNLKNALSANQQGVSEATFPLPAGGPAINADGLCFAYDAGEIASPDRGQPVGSVKLQSVWGCFNATAKKWLK